MSQLFSRLDLRKVTFGNRVWVSPMCQYSAVDGVPGDWHLAHLGSFARGGAGLVFTEATAVSAEGRISPADTGIWNDEQMDAWSRIVDFVHDQGPPAGIQLAHAGRKGSSVPPWEGRAAVADEGGGWEPVAPSPLASDGLRRPRELSRTEIGDVVASFAAATERAVRAGFDVLEIHAAHGYLLHEFCSPLSNQRTDDYGGSFENRVRIVLEVVDAVRAAAPEQTPVFVRLSATDWVDGGWDVDSSVRLAALLRSAGVDLVDVSSGGNVRADIPVEPGYQVGFARRIRHEADIPTAAVGMITEPRQAEDVVSEGSADAVLLARALLRNPHWALLAAHELGVRRGEGVEWPKQYLRAAAD